MAEKKLPRYKVLHFIPFAIFTINQSFYYLQAADFKYNSFITSRGLDLPLRINHTDFSSDPMKMRDMGGLFTTISLAVYMIFIFMKLLKILRQARVMRSPGGGSVIWMRNLALLTMLLVLFIVINQVVGGNPESEYIIGTGLTIIIYYTGYHFIRYSYVLNELCPVAKYEKTSLPEEMKKVIKKRLITHMENDKPYLNNMFSLKQLSENILASPNHVSRIINEDLNKSYYDFISGYRINEACKYLMDPEYASRTIEDISCLVGYNSKAAFNKAFKKFTGITPLYFKKNPEMYLPVGKHLISAKKSNAQGDRESLDH